MQTMTDFRSVGRIAADLQRHVDEIFAAADELDISPSFLINSVAHYDDAVVDKIARHLRQSDDPR